VAIANPVGKPKLPAYLIKYGYPSYKQQAARKSKETLSALAISPDERFVAVGAMFDGSVEVYVTFNLQLVKRVPNAHKSFITGLEFFPGFRAAHEASVLSISVDNTVQVHHVARRREVPLVPVLVLGVIVLIATFCFCSYVDSYLTS
jgi:WD40 repeat protein